MEKLYLDKIILVNVAKHGQRQNMKLYFVAFGEYRHAIVAKIAT